MEPNFEQRFSKLEEKLDAVYRSSEKLRKLFWAVVIISVVAFVLPLIGLVFVIPSFLEIYTGVLNI